MAVEVLAAKAPSLREALDRAAEQGLPYLILDGTLISSDRCADKKTSRKGEEIDKWYSGKAHEPAGNVQALAAPSGVPLWVSDVLPGSTHDLTAARELVFPGARPYLKDLPFLADSGYEGAGAGVHVPVKKPRRGELDIDTKTRNALLRSLRYQGERGFALMSQRWRAIQHVSLSPTTIGDIAKSALVLTQFEHKMIVSNRGTRGRSCCGVGGLGMAKLPSAACGGMAWAGFAGLRIAGITGRDPDRRRDDGGRVLGVSRAGRGPGRLPPGQFRHCGRIRAGSWSAC